MKPFELRIDIVILRFYLMMAIIIASIMGGVPFLAILGLPVFLSALMGLKFFPAKKQNHAKTILLVSEKKNKSKIA